MKKKVLAGILSILMLVVLVTAGLFESGIIELNKDKSYTTSQYQYAGTYKVMITGDELKWVDSVKIIDKQIIVTAKQEADRTYEECVEYDNKDLDELGESSCLRYENVIYEIPISIPITKEDNKYVTSKTPTQELDSKTGITKDVFKYDIKDEHYLKLGEHSIYVIEDIVTSASLVNVTAEANYTHLTIDSSNSPYDSLVFYMPFDGDKVNTKLTTHYDFTSNDNDGIGFDDALVNSTDCVYGDCLNLDGTGDYVTIGDDEDIDFVDEDFTISFWMKANLNDLNYDDRFVMKGTGSGGCGAGKRYEFFVGKIEDTKQMGFTIDDNVNKIAIQRTGAYFDGGWHHIVVVRNTTSNLFKMYIDGSQDGADVTDTATNISNGCDLHLGRFESVGGYEPKFSMDEYMMFKTALNPSQVADIYNNQSSRFLASGIQSFTQAITGDNTNVLVTGEYQANIGSSINLTLYYYNSTGWFSAGEQVYDGDNAFTINSASTELSLNFTQIAGSNNGDYSFYSPIILGENGITLTTYRNCAYDGTGNWIINKYCEYSDSNTNIDGNLTIMDMGTMNCIVNQCNLNFTETNQYLIFENVADTQNKLIGNWTINSP